MGLLDTLLLQERGAMSLQVVVGTLLPFAGALPGSVVIRKNLDWYEYIKKPSWMPPEWVYGPVWTLLFAVMGYASHLVYQEGADTTALLLYGLHNVKLATLDISALWLNVAVCGLKFYSIN